MPPFGTANTARRGRSRDGLNGVDTPSQNPVSEGGSLAFLRRLRQRPPVIELTEVRKTAPVRSARSLARGRVTPIERLAAWLILLLLGGLQAFVFADRLDPDGIAYLDIAAAYARGDWDAAVNPYWSPALSWILALLERPFALAGCGGLARVHVVMVAIFAFALWSFERLVLALDATGAGPDATGRAWRWFTYAIFGMVVMQMIGLVWLTPDILLLGLVCLALAFGLRTVAPDATRRSAGAFGLSLAAAYWAKSPLLPLSFVVLGTAWWLARGPGRRRVAVAASVFVAAGAAWIVPLSIHEGRPTFGDAGRLNATWFLGSVRPYTHWQGGDETGSPVHPMIRAEHADAFAFPEPFDRVTYPPWYNPAHWHEGVRPRFRLGAVVDNGADGVRTVFGSTPVPFAIASIVALWLLGRPGRKQEVRRNALLLVIPGMVGLAGYIVLHVELRLVAPMVLLSWLGLAAMPRLRAGAAERWAGPLCLGFAVLMMMFPLRDAARQIDWLRAGVTPGRDQDCAIAAQLAARGIDRGTRIAVAGDASAAAWAWIGGLRIVADMPDPQTYWSLDGGGRDRLERFFARAGARALVAPVPATLPVPGAEGWLPLGSTGHVLREIGPSEAHEPAGSARTGAGDPVGQPPSAEHEQAGEGQ